MKNKLLYLTIIAVATTTEFKPGLRVKYGDGDEIGTEYFYDVPRNLTAAVNQNWTLTERPRGQLPSLVLYCPGDDTIYWSVCGYFDNETSRIGGLQICVPQDQIIKREYDWKTQGFIEWAPTNSAGVVKKYWITQLMFISEEYLQLTPQERNATYNDKMFLQENAVWMSGYYGHVDRLSANETDIKNSIYTVQACLNSMGLHYFYNLTVTTECHANTIYTWFGLVVRGRMFGIGFATPVKTPIISGQRNWYERPTKAMIKAILSNGPECNSDFANDSSVLTLHIFFTDTPWLIDCTDIE